MIKLENIQVKYGDFVAIDHVNIEVEEGEFFTLLGPSGCGKSTTLRAIAGFSIPSKGRILIDDEDITYTPIEDRKLGMVFQSYALFPTMNVYDNIAFGLKVEKKDKEFIDQRVKELAKLVNLNDEQLYKNVSALSGGQQQRVAIARALALSPDIVLFDEPLSNLDAKLRKSLRKEIKRIQREAGMTAIYVTHDQEEALVMSDHIAVFNDGYIEQIGTPDEIYNHSRSEFVCNFIGDANLLSEDIVKEVNKISGSMIKLENNNYIRYEKIKTRKRSEDDPSVKVVGIVKDRQFFGVNAVYDYDVMGTIVKSVEKEDGNKNIRIGEEIDLYIDPKDILSYEGQ
ncbi:MAG: ABC transporter ATP-binding protein [Tissierellia bacterium]|nr:ABC transporter ATP-binding protein [Tissierellia bacterium]